MVDAAAVRALARGVDGLAERVAGEVVGLRVLAAPDWSGPAYRVYAWAVEEAVQRALQARRALLDSGAELQRHATAVEAAEGERRLVALRASEVLWEPRSLGSR